MRALKFDIIFWDGTPESITHPSLEEAFNEGYVEFDGDTIKPTDESTIIRPFTGLFDKNKKDIYEGDILRTEGEKAIVVAWSKLLASFCIEKNGWAYSHFFGEAVEPYNCEIIGNIHQHPELIK